MKVIVERLKSDDFDDLIDLLDLVFSQAHGHLVDFRSVFPRIFKPQQPNMSWHFGLRESGRLRAVVANYPMQWKVGGEVLKVASSGNMVVHLASRGKGYMTAVMNAAGKALEEDEYDFSVLHGDRMRYEYYRYAQCGTEQDFLFSRKRLTALLGEMDISGFSWIAFENMDIQSQDAVFDAFQKETVRVERTREDFLLSLKAHRYEPWVCCDPQGRICALLTVYPSHARMSELYLFNVSLGCLLLSFFHAFTTDMVSIAMHDLNSRLTAEAVKLCDWRRLQPCANFRILNAPKVIRAFLEQKCLESPLVEGKLCLNTEAFGKLAIEVRDQKVSVDCDFDVEADITLEGMDAYDFLFGLSVPVTNLSPDKTAYIHSWLPIPLYFPPLT